MDSLTSESIHGCPKLEKNHGVTKMADEVILKTPDDASCIEQMEDSILNDCTINVRENPIPLAPEPVSYTHLTLPTKA